MPPEQQDPIQSTTSQEQTPTKSHKALLIAVSIFAVVILVIVASIFAYKSYTSPTSPLSENVSGENSIASSTTATSTTTVTAPQLPDFSLYIPPSAQDIADGNAVDYSSITYQGDGDVPSGQYAGYHIVVAVKRQVVPSAEVGAVSNAISTYNDYDFFITKDYKTFLVATDFYNFSYYLFENFDKTKVTGDASGIPTNFPQLIPIGHFVLVRRGPDSSMPNTPELHSNVPGLKFFSGNIWFGSDGFSTSSPYVQGDTGIQVEDSYGVPFNYALVSKEAYNRALSSGNATSSTSGNNFIAYNEFSNSFFKKSDFSSGFASYNSYDYLLPTHCGEPESVGSVLSGINNSDLLPLGATESGLQLYTLKDTSHPLNKAEYDAKVTSNGNFGGQYGLYSTSTKPSYAQYASKNPIIIFQDPWGRWLGVGEYDYSEPLGCGKPVIYLYPPKPTIVSVKFSNPVSFKVDIPTYTDGWKVLAKPNGELEDLEPHNTDCSKIDSSVFGSEYAAQACTKNLYPYLYWAGQVVGTYPTPTGGWIVSRSDLLQFLTDKLAELGLNKKESSDMLSFWVPALLQKTVPYYRISFFQTAQINRFIPMQIVPRPDSTLRIFLDWTPLSALPAQMPEPETLYPFVRDGFTVVEWGGLEQ